MQPYYDLSDQHQIELRGVAEDDRLARRFEPTRVVRRRVGDMLIRAGHRVAGYRMGPVAILEPAPVETSHPAKGC
jgi:hypothetical protein